MNNAVTVPETGAHSLSGSALLTANRQICVVIPTYNRVDRLRMLLSQLSTQVIPKGYDLLPLVVNDGSPDDTEQMLRKEFPFYFFCNRAR
jgi:glycosyltransferase involved in cell wall biosynthesis